jgi:cytochrome c553
MGGQTMKRVSLESALLAAAFAVSISGASRAEGAAAAGFKQALQAKIEYCKTCHGLSGQGYRGSSPMPRLAGQPVEYIENQLQAFNEHRRDNKFMYNVSHVLSPEMRKGLAEHFNGLNPKPLGGASKTLAAAGKAIYQEGVSKSDVPACASCHGPEAKGDGPYPRLAGQLNDYIVSKLTNWDKERGLDPKNQDTSTIMQPIAHNLTKEQIAAVAAYVSFLE